MSLRAQVKRAVLDGFKAIGDLAQRCSYISASTPTYNTETGVVTSPSTTYTNIRILFGSFTRREIDGQAIRMEDQKALIATLDLIPVPTVNDTILDEDGVTWSVIGILSGPGRVAWSLHVRRP